MMPKVYLMFRKKTGIYDRHNGFNTDVSHPYQYDQFISVLRVVVVLFNVFKL